MRFAQPVLFFLVVCLATVGCNRKKRGASAATPQFPPEAVQAVVAAEQSPQASLALLNETLKEWVLRRNEFPKDLNEFVTGGMLPRLPAAPLGKRFVMDVQQRRVVLADQ